MSNRATNDRQSSVSTSGAAAGELSAWIPKKKSPSPCGQVPCTSNTYMPSVAGTFDASAPAAGDGSPCGSVTSTVPIEPSPVISIVVPGGTTRNSLTGG